MVQVVGAVKVFQSVDHTGPENKAAGSLLKNLGSIHATVRGHSIIRESESEGPF